MNSEGLEHLSSVQNNPFIRQYGLPQYSVSQQDAVEREPSIPSSASSDKGDDDSVQEYHVNSGFVNKLRSKFAQLENRSQKVSLSRKSASVENLLSIGQSSNDLPLKHRRWPKDDSTASSSVEKVELRKHAPAGYKPQIGRPRSYELENNKLEKPALAKKKELEHLSQKNIIRSVKPPLPKKNTTDFTKIRGYSRKPGVENTIPKHEHHDWKVAPDVEKIGRDNIIIIESNDLPTVSQNDTSAEKSGTNEDSTDGFRQVKPVTEMEPVRDENEMPKPNTVSQFRSLFEKTSKTQDTLNAWQQFASRRKSSESDVNSPRVTSPVSVSPRSPLVKMTDNVFEDSQKESNNVRSPRNSSNLETNTPLSPRNSSSITDYAQAVDTTPMDIQKSRELFRKNSVDIDKDLQTNRSSSSDRSEEPLSPSIQNTLSPVHPLSKVFDSSKVVAKKADKPRRPKPAVLAKRTHHPIPKDTIELKHEMDQKNKQTVANDTVELRLKHDRRKHGIPKDTVELKHEADQRKRDSLLESQVSPTLELEENIVKNDSSEDVISKVADTKPSGRSFGKISPRKTEIFDSSNIVKKDKEPPNTPLSPVENVPSFMFSNNVPKEVSIEIKDADGTKPSDENNVEVAMDISPVRPSKTDEKQVGGLTEIKPKIEHKPKPRMFKVKEQNFMKAETVSEAKPTVTNTSNDSDAPITGMSSFLANRLKKQQEQENQLKTSSVHLANGSSPSPVPRKRQAPERPISNGPLEDIEKPAPPLPDTPEPALPKTNDDIVRPSKKKTAQPATKMVFDSSKIASKRKEPPKRKPPRKTVDQLNKDSSSNGFSVPKLDLTSITDDKQESAYQEGYIPTIIHPCPFKFLGAEVVFEKSPFRKTSKNAKKVKISFDDHATTTFEYDDEELALEKYLEEHPEEREEALRQEEEVNGDIGGPTEDLLNERIPMEPEPTMKSNTVLGTSGGGLTSYKSKIQTQEFQFGMRPEPEVVEDVPEPDPEDKQQNLDLLPADDAETDMFSAELDKPDMLF